MVISNAQQGARFEERVAELLVLRGYMVSRNELIAGTQIDIVARRNDPLDNICLLVECGDRKASVGVDMIKQKAAILVSASSPDEIYRMLYVSRVGFTAEAKAFARSQSRVILMTYSELEQQLVNFLPYVEWFCQAYEESKGLFAEGKLQGSYIDPAVFENGQKYESFSEKASEWLSDSAHQLLFLLGEYGSGKTSASRYFTYEWLKQEQVAETRGSGRVPVLINLRDYRRAFNVQQMVTDTLLNQYGVQLSNYRAFERLCSIGRVLLVLDGFDEMISSVSEAAVVDAFAQLLILAALDVKTIITCRTNMFASNRELLALLRKFAIETPDDPLSGALSVPIERAGRIVTIAPWDDSRIRKFVTSVAPVNGSVILNSIRSIHDLTDLASRPVLLDMVVKTLPKLLDNESTVNSAALYGAYTEMWTSRDDWRTKTSAAVRTTICEGLAVAMQASSLSSMDYAAIRQVIELIFSSRPSTKLESNLDEFEADIRVCSFLVRSGEDRYLFAHKSFIEYFVARAIVSQLLMGDEEATPLSSIAGKSMQDTLSSNRRWADSINQSNFLLFSDASEYAHMTSRLSFSNWHAGAYLWGSRKPDLHTLITNHIWSVHGKPLERKAYPVRVTAEIAVFVLEILALKEVSIKQMLDTLDSTDLSSLLADVFHNSPLTDYVRRHAEDMESYLRTGSNVPLMAATGIALCRIPDMRLDFLVELRKRLDYPSWMNCLVEVADSPHIDGKALRDLVDSFDDPDLMERILGVWAMRSDTNDPSIYMAVRELAEAALASESETELEVAMSFLTELEFETEGEAVAFFKLLQSRRVSESVLMKAVPMLESARGVNAPKMIRSLWARESNPTVRQRLQKAEEHIRTNVNQSRERTTWTRGTRADLRANLWEALRR